jgi:hypothetical protein
MNDVCNFPGTLQKTPQTNQASSNSIEKKVIVKKEVG